MIDHLYSSLRALGALSAMELESPSAEALRRDCADAVRLELDCRQLELGAFERAVLERLSDTLESADVGGEALAAAVRDGAAVLGIAGRKRGG